MQKDKNQSDIAGDVKHPSEQEWMGWLYGEVSRAEKASLAAHLKECGGCRAEVNRWERAQSALDLDKTVTPRVRAEIPAPWLKWGIAAGLALMIGFSAGRRAGASDVQAMRASLKVELSAELAEYKTSAEQKTAQDNKLILAALGKAEADRLADSAWLRKELETVAVTTQDSLQETHQQIVTLANYTRPEDKVSGQ
jgi:hypothetical protein